MNSVNITNIELPEIIAVLEEEIDMYHSSFVHRVGEHQGKVIDPSANRTINCLKAAIERLRKDDIPELKIIRQRLAANAEDFDGIIADWLRWSESQS